MACRTSIANDETSWDFSVFDLDRASNHHPIAYLVHHYVGQFKLHDALPINMANLERLLLRVEECYGEVPFHNRVHAADVTHGTAYFLSLPRVAQIVSPLDLYAMLLAAPMHDLRHPGFNNAFLVASKHQLSEQYSGAVLEKFHVANAFELMSEDGCDPFSGFSDEQRCSALATIEHTILGTDMARHFEHLSEFKTRVASGAFDAPNADDVHQLLIMCLHAADVSNPAKCWTLSSEWSCRVMREFFLQGDKEADLGLPVSAFMDRTSTDIAKCQAGFAKAVILPFFDEWTTFLGNGQRDLVLGHIEANVKRWEEQGEAALGKKAAALHRPPPAGAIEVAQQMAEAVARRREELAKDASYQVTESRLDLLERADDEMRKAAWSSFKESVILSEMIPVACGIARTLYLDPEMSQQRPGRRPRAPSHRLHPKPDPLTGGAPMLIPWTSTPTPPPKSAGPLTSRYARTPQQSTRRRVQTPRSSASVGQRPVSARQAGHPLPSLYGGGSPWSRPDLPQARPTSAMPSLSPFARHDVPRSRPTSASISRIRRLILDD